MMQVAHLSGTGQSFTMIQNPTLANSDLYMQSTSATRWTTLTTLLLGVTHWASWSVIVVLLAKSNLSLDPSQLMLLVGLAGVSGAAFRFVGIFLGRLLGPWKPAATNVLLLGLSLLSWQAFSLFEVSYVNLMGLAALSGVGCMMFAPAFDLTRRDKETERLPMSMSLVIGMMIFAMFTAQLIIPFLSTWQADFMQSGLILERSSGHFFSRVDAGQPIMLSTISALWMFVFAAMALLSIGVAWLSPQKTPSEKAQSDSQLLRNAHVWYCSILYNMTFGSFIGFAMVLPLVLELVFGYSTLILVWMAPFIALLARPFGRWLAGIFGGAVVTQISLLLMIVFGAVAGWYLYLAQNDTAELYFEPFFISMMGLVFTSALGNGSVVVTMTKVFPRAYTHKVLTWAGTVAMLGAVYLPFRFTIALESQSLDLVFVDFVVFYLAGVILNGWMYLRKHAQFYNP